MYLVIWTLENEVELADEWANDPESDHATQATVWDLKRKSPVYRVYPE